MFTIGLTGGIGSGKSTVADYFAQLGITVIDADIIAREVVAPGTSALTQIIQYFGPDILDEQEQLDRDKLKQLIFSNTTARRWLEELLHPLILMQMVQAIQNATSAYCVLVIPLLLEKKVQVDRILVVDTTPELQILRTQQRDHLNAEQVQAIVKTQIEREKRLAQANDIIDNSADLKHLAHQVQQLHLKYLNLVSR